MQPVDVFSMSQVNTLIHFQETERIFTVMLLEIVVEFCYSPEQISKMNLQHVAVVTIMQPTYM
jgi:hypothetical protein